MIAADEVRVPGLLDAHRIHTCRCGRPVFFQNSVCLGCNAMLGYEAELGTIFALEPGPDADTFVLAGGPDHRSSQGGYRLCANRSTACACNWLTNDPNTLCISCRLNRTIPNLDDPRRSEQWHRIEVAKRQLVSSLVTLGLPVHSKDEDPRGLAFDFLSDDSGKVVTGHQDGVITLNVDEADNAAREKIREQLHEPYRTVLGHLRHESGHYYWDRLVWDSEWIEGFRGLFGDERADYGQALEAHYQQGPPADWQERFVTSYASSHPWEDWAETWAHYLHIGDALSTAASFGLKLDSGELTIHDFGNEDLVAPDDLFLDLIHSWVRLTAALNELSRSMGLQDFYPFVLSKSAVRKLHFVHRLVGAR